MRTLFKYLFILITFLLLVFYYLLNTSSGKKDMNGFLSRYLSANSNNEITVYEFDLREYPQIEMGINVNKRANVILHGLVRDNYKINVRYHIWGDDVEFNNMVFPDSLDIRGEINGSFGHTFVNGKGMLLGGEGVFEFKKISNNFKDVEIELDDISSKNFFILLKKKPMFHGDADVIVKIAEYGEGRREGKGLYHLSNGTIDTPQGVLPISFTSEITIDNRRFEYKMDMNSSVGKVSFINGEFDPKSQIISSEYYLDIYDLAFFEKLLNRKVEGELKTKGRLIYDDSFNISGVVSKFGGDIHYIYDQRIKEIKLILEKVSLEQILKELGYPVQMRADIFGEVLYDIKNGIVVFDNRFKKTRLQKNRITDMVFKVSEIDMTNYLYDKSSFLGFYKNSLLRGDLRIDSGKEHIYFDTLQFNRETKQITSDLHIKMAKQEVAGKITGTISDPKFELNLSHLLKYQLKKGVTELLGEEKSDKIKREIVEIERQLDEVNMESVTEKTKKLFNDFF